MGKEKDDRVFGKTLRVNAEIINPAEHGGWDEFVGQHPLGSFYHQAAWAKVIKESFSHTEPQYFVLTNDKEEIQAGLPLFLVKSRLLGNRLVSLPFTPHCDPLFKTEDQLKELLDETLAYQSTIGAKYLEFRTFNMPLKCAFTPNHHHIVYELELNQSPEAVKRLFHRGCIQRSIKKAYKNNLKIRWGDSEKDLRVFYDLLVLTRRKHGFPPQPYRFYLNMWNHFFEKNRLSLPLAVYNDQIIAGILLLKYRERVHYEFAASDEKHLDVRPNHFLIWESIKAAYRDGFKVFDFGKTPTNNGGLVKFKERWGASARPLTYYYSSGKEAQNQLSENSFKYFLAKEYFRRAPLSLAKLGGYFVYRHIG